MWQERGVGRHLQLHPYPPLTKGSCQARTQVLNAVSSQITPATQYNVSMKTPWHVFSIKAKSTPAWLGTQLPGPQHGPHHQRILFYTALPTPWRHPFLGAETACRMLGCLQDSLGAAFPFPWAQHTADTQGVSTELNKAIQACFGGLVDCRNGREKL